MHVLEAGELGTRRCSCCMVIRNSHLRLKVMPPLTAAGYRVTAPDLRGYGRTTGWDGDYDGDLWQFRMLNLTLDVVALSPRWIPFGRGRRGPRLWRGGGGDLRSFGRTSSSD